MLAYLTSIILGLGWLALIGCSNPGIDKKSAAVTTHAPCLLKPNGECDSKVAIVTEPGIQSSV